MPFSLAPLPLAVAAFAFFLAGFVKGVVGLGLPPVAMGLLTLVMMPSQAAALLVVPAFVTNVWQLAAGPRFGAIVSRLWPMLAASVVGTLGAAAYLHGSFGGQAIVALGFALIASAVLGLAAPRLVVPPGAERWLAPLAGAATGLVTAATGVSSIPAAPFLGALGFNREDLIQALGLSFTVSTIALAVALTMGGVLGVGTAGLSVLALVPALLGMRLGGWVRGRVSESVFRRCFFLGLLGLGLHLASRALI
ncbi:sulfite exporter TauE/SafE family protein [Methylobacterium durans]|uniref:Probable membrane transporter protein n=1 Tax=Methylobacterium durans TaxID=2202825 RepID=A0A2U8W111_9HYPH|nr:sulfite exporter TauE/SafE family protein [Methylobacterium durans]AWN39735.1 sulfite exporter TauE/SafE family protein [Methylobacterium durans]